MFASQFAVLKGCPEAMSRLLRESSPVLLAAKVLVISRLLHTKLSQRPRPPPYLENIRNRLATLRRRLLAKIDKRMKSLDITRDALVDAMCAFSLATSSSPTDVLRHFHHVRIEAISEQGRERSDSHESILRAMRLYIGTLKDTRAIIPTMLAQALESLKSIPLLKSQDLYTLLELNLDLHESRIEDDVRTFTPYIRLNDLQKSESESHLKQWAKRALSSLLDDLRKHLESFTDTLKVMDLRKHLFELWFSNQHQCTGIEPSEVVDGLRSAFNLRWAEIIRTQSTSLTELGMMIRNTVEDYPNRATPSSRSLWDSTVTSMDISHGGRAFREKLIATAQGSNDTKTVSHQYTKWLQSVEDIEATIVSVQAIDWEDTGISIDDYDDVLNDKQVLLNEDDPRLLREQCSKSVQQALCTLEDILGAVAEELNEISDGQKAMLVLRIWRDIRQRMPKNYQRHDLGLTSIARLQKVAAKTVLWKPTQRCRKRIAKAAGCNKVPGRPLWEGDPPLPVLPSPWVFRLLREIMSSMAEGGSDIWSAHATDTLKKELRQTLVASFDDFKPRTSFPNGHPAETTGSDGDSHQQRTRSDSVGSAIAPTETETNGSPTHDTLTNGDLPKAHVEGRSPECRIQEVFDLIYLSRATTLKQSEHRDDAYVTLQSKLEAELEVEQDSIHRLEKSAENYWKRTSLLFALLA